METLINNDKQSNLQELTKNEALSINGGDGFWEEVGQFAANVGEIIKDIADDDEWWG